MEWSTPPIPPEVLSPEQQALIEGILDRLLESRRSFIVRGELVIQGVLYPFYEGRWDEVRALLGNLPGRYLLERADGRTHIILSLALEPRAPQRWALHLGLFLATLLSVLASGALIENRNPLEDWRNLAAGIPFAVTLLAILLGHELGHFLAARRYGLDVSLPYFIPFPFFNVIGTLGAFIRIRSPILSKRVLVDVGAAGPIVGFLLCLPAAIYGLAHSAVQPLPPPGVHTLSLGSSVLFSLLSWLVVGPVSQGYDVFLHPVAFAGWLGLFVTALNLIPVGQLDGGHILYGLLGRRQHYVAWVCFLVLLPLGFLWEGWLFWAILLLLVIRIKHPPLVDEGSSLSPARRLLAWLSILIFLLTFVPQPFQVR